MHFNSCRVGLRVSIYRDKCRQHEAPRLAHARTHVAGICFVVSCWLTRCLRQCLAQALGSNTAEQSHQIWVARHMTNVIPDLWMLAISAAFRNAAKLFGHSGISSSEAAYLLQPSAKSSILGVRKSDSPSFMRQLPCSLRSRCGDSSVKAATAKRAFGAQEHFNKTEKLSAANLPTGQPFCGVAAPLARSCHRNSAHVDGHWKFLVPKNCLDRSRKIHTPSA